MTRKQLIFKTLAICAILLAGIIFPTILTAQRSDGFFKANDEDIYDNRDEITLHNNIGNDSFGVPVGSGLIVLTIAGAGYAIVRRKRSLRNVTTLMLAFALLFGMTQCKKRIETVTTDSGNTIQITLKTSYDAKHYIDLDKELGYSPVSFVSGDVMYVGDGMSYIGQLTYDNGDFSGNVTTPGSAATHLYFYYVGNLNPTWNTDNSAFTVDISDQKNNNVQNNNSKLLPVLSCARVVYESGVTNYECSLHNQCVLVRFEIPTNEGRTDEYRLSNMYSEAMVDFTSDVDPEIVPTGVVDAITLYCGPHNQLNNNNQNGIQLNYKYRWAILLKTEQARHAYLIRGYDKDSRIYYEMGDVGPFNPGDPADNYIYDQYTINNSATNITPDRLFVVSNNGNVVQFAPGNLQYQASTNTWRFAEHPWDYVGNDSKGTVYEGGVKCSNTQISPTYSGWIDLFGWGCTGKQDSIYHTSQLYYYPYSATMANGNDAVNRSYGPTGVHNLRTSGPNSNWGSDWGSVQISNTTENGWRTLTYKEWAALRNNWSIEHRGLAQIKEGTDVISQGVILLPLNYSGDAINDGSSSWATNVYTRSEWEAMAANGAVFIPYSFYRYSTDGTNFKMGNRGYYWVSSSKSALKSGYASMVNGSSYVTTVEDGMTRSCGLSVRLAR